MTSFKAFVRTPVLPAVRGSTVTLGLVLLQTILAAGTETRHPPFQKLVVPPLEKVKVEDEFWAPRIRTCCEVTLPYCFETCRNTGRIANFLKAARKMAGAFEGLHFNDSDVYKVVEGAEWALAVHPDAALRKLADDVVSAIVGAQDADGYLDTYFTIGRREERFQHLHPNARHELYCMGHAIEAGAARYTLTGKRDFLEVARRLADHIDSIFGPGKRSEVPEHQQLELALVKLYRVTGEERYLKLARFFVDERGNAEEHKLYGAYSQDHLPFRRQSEVVGHAVRAMYNCSGAADLYSETGDPELLGALRRLWESTTQRKMYVTGGIGATRHGEAFSSDYDLPNASAYSETCAQIGLIFFAHRMLLIEPDARHADVMERVLYNGFLSGISLSGSRFFYQNRLASRGDYHRRPWYACACCPSNVVRVLPRIAEYVYSQSGDPAREANGGGDGNALYVNLYVGGRGAFVIDKRQVEVRQETRYPWDGKVTLFVEPEESQVFALYLRIPGWCRDGETPGRLYRWEPAATDVTLKINGQPVEMTEHEKGYAKMRRRWEPGDKVELDLPMPILRVHAHPSVSADRGRVALQRGPVVYCVEAVDHEAPVHEIILPATARLTARHRPELLGGITVITGTGRIQLGDGSMKEVALQAIPYHVWDNREGGDMAVWLTENPQQTGPWKTSAWVGSNYTPAHCVNQVQMWHEFPPEVVEEELTAARKHLGITTLRVYLHNLPYDAEKNRFLGNVEKFLEICARHGIRPGFTFFDDCHRHEGITLDSMPPVKGWHNGRWAACPQDRERTEENLPKFKAYIQDVIGAHAKDSRVLWWEIFNEPNLRSEFSVNLRRRGYAWAKELEPVQPVISCWDKSAVTDIVDAHAYTADFAAWDRQVKLNPAKGTVFTEAGARWYAPRPSNGEPCEVIHWLTTRRAEGKYVPGVYLCWELMVGNSNCRWYWGTKPQTPEPTVPWCGLLWPDGTPVSLAEAEAIRRYTTGERRALFFDDFQAAPERARPDWTTYGARRAGSRVLELGPGMKMIAGHPTWSDYVVESRVMLRSDEGNAGVVLRVNDPGDGNDEMRGYYVGFDTKTLYAGRMDNAWKQLATLDLEKIECKAMPGVWNLLRVAVEGPRIRVWFNRMHHDENEGLRLDCTDPGTPVRRGSVGVRTHRVSAWFDNFVVLPLSALPKPSVTARR